MERKNINRGFKQLDKLHYKTENEIIQLIKSIQKKMKNGEWDDTF